MPISYIEAYGRIGTAGYQSVSELTALANSVSGKVESAPIGSTFLLYSGQLNDGTWASNSVNGLMDAGIRHVGQSEVGAFLNDPTFKSALQQAVINEVLQGAPASGATPEQRDRIYSRYNELYSGVDNSSSRVNSNSL